MYFYRVTLTNNLYQLLMKRALFLVAALSCVVMGFAGEKVKTSTKNVPATNPSEDIAKETEIIHVYMDTTFTYTTKTVKNEIVQPEDTSFTRKGHYFQFLVGAGYGSMGYSLYDLKKGLKDARNGGGLNWTAEFNYVYYFHENVGFMVGLMAEQMNSSAVLNGTKTWSSAGDSDNGEEYSHTVTMNDWKEHQTSFLLGVPVGFQFQFPIAKMNVSHRNNQVRMYADVAAKANYLVGQKYNLVSGSITHSGVYEKWNLSLDQQIGIDRDYYTETIGTGDGWRTTKRDLGLSAISVDGMVDLGFMIPLQEHLDLMIGIYGNYTFNNLREGKGKEIGWRNDNEEGYRQHTFMEPYKGVLATNYVSAVRPWDVGLKVGISWNMPAKKPKQYENLVMRDTTYTVSRREEVENIPVAAKKINDIMKKSVIWFDFDSDKPKLQPADVVDKIAEVLLEHPEQMVLVYGHASKEGSMEYNQNLSERRAASIVRLLKKKGVPSEQIVSKGFSYTQQYDDSENPYHNIALDRRVEIIPVFEKDRISE